MLVIVIFSVALAFRTDSYSLRERVDAFNAWLRPHLSLSDNLITAAVDDEYRVAAIAVKDVGIEQLYCSIPMSHVMSVEAAMKSDVKEVFEAIRVQEQRQSSFYILLLFLLYEASKPQSFYKPYIDLLPTLEEVDRPVRFEAHLVSSELEGMEMATSLTEDRDSVLNGYHIVKRILSPFSDIFPCPTLEDYSWASEIVNSRAIWFGSGRNLVPLLDLINCKDIPGARVHRTVLNKEGTHAVTYAPYSFREGEQVFENYGQTNDIYYRYHGFVLEPNTYDCFRVQFRLIPGETESLRRAKEKILSKLVRSPATTLCLSAHSRHAQHVEIALIYELVKLAESESKLENIGTGRLGGASRRLAASYLILRLDDILERMIGGSLDEELQSLTALNAGKERTKLQRISLIGYRYSRKKLLLELREKLARFTSSEAIWAAKNARARRSKPAAADHRDEL